MGRRRRPRLPQDPVEVAVESLNHDGKGVSRVDDKVVFIHGALPGERVKFRYTGRYRRHDEGIAVEILESAPQRVEPACPHYGVCGGCALQHMDAAAQIEAKQVAGTALYAAKAVLNGRFDDVKHLLVDNFLKK